MSWTACPICSHKNSAATARCAACGADFDDPDVRALAGVTAAAPGLSPAAGALSAASFLGVSLDGLGDGHSLRRLALAAAAAGIIGFLLPLTSDYRQLHAAWSLLGDGPVLALLLPLVASLFALAFGLARDIPTAAGAGALALLGVVGLVTLPTLGRFGGGPEALVPLHAIGLSLAAGALIVRLARPLDRGARLGLLTGSALAALGLFVKIGGGSGLPFELGGAETSDAATGLAYLELLGRESRSPFVLFGAFAMALPIGCAAAATLLAWPRHQGPWDRSALPLRALGWGIVIAPALVAAELAFNLTGWSDRGLAMINGNYVRLEDLMSGAVIGRLRSGLLGTIYMTIAGFGLAALYLARMTVPAAATTARDIPSA